MLTPVPGERDLGLVDALAQAAFAIHGTLGRIAADHDVSIAQLRLLGILRDRNPTVTELAGFLQLDKSSVTGMVDRARDRGLVRRVPSKLDGRSVCVAVTAAGRRLIDAAGAAFAAEVDDLVEGLSVTQQSRLSQVLSHVVAADAHRRGINLFDAG